MKSLISACVLVAALLAPINCYALAVLLGQFDITTSGSAGFSGELLDSVSFQMTFNSHGASQICLGCDLVFPIRDVPQSITFDPDNTVNFYEAMGFVTNGIDEIHTHNTLFTGPTEYAMGGGGGNYESEWFRASPDLIGRQIDFVTLNINYYLPPRKTAPASYSVSVVWEFWGTGDPAPGRPPASVPEPSTLLLLVSGIVGMAAWCRK